MKPEQIRRIRKRLGLSQRVFAQIIGASKISVLRWENGHTKMHPIFEKQIREHFNREVKGAA